MYTVKKGDTLSSICSDKYDDSSLYNIIAELNSIENPEEIYVGQKIKLPKRHRLIKEMDGDGHARIEVSSHTLLSLCPHLNERTCHAYCTSLNSQMKRYGICTKLQISHFLSQILHESNMLRATTENLNYSASALKVVFGKYFKTTEKAEQFARNPEQIANIVYANRMGNRGKDSGDGWRYRGRGLIQLTGKNNYKKFNQTVGADVINNPDLVSSDLELCVASACWFWQKNRLNKFADIDDVIKVTKRINGGTNGLEHRKALLSLVKNLLID